MKKEHSIICLAILLLIACSTSNQSKNPQVMSSAIISRGIKLNSPNFTGVVWLEMLLESDTLFNVNAGNVFFEPGARTNWHSHPGGQILFITEGKGLYQEKGMPIKQIKKGEIVKCLPNTVHWHGASPNSSMSHMAIGTNQNKGSVIWKHPVSDAEYLGGE